jgi:hypothetical protein
MDVYLWFSRKVKDTALDSEGRRKGKRKVSL